MSGHDHSDAFAARAPAKTRSHSARSFSAIGAAAVAIAAVAAFGGTLVTLDQTGSLSARAATTMRLASVAPASGWALQPRWWPGEIRLADRPVVRQVAPLADDGLSFSKGYAQRLAARQAALAARLAAIGPSAETQFGRAASAPRKPVTLARLDRPLDLGHVAPARVDGIIERPAPSEAPRGQALAYGDQRSVQGGVAQSHGDLFATLFGNLH